MTSIFNEPEPQTIPSEHDPYRSHLVPEELPYDFQQAAEAQAATEPKQLSDATKLGIGLLAAALLAGIGGNWLMRGVTWGINVGIWVAIVLVLIMVLIQRSAQPKIGAAKWLTLPTLFFAATFAWRDSLTLNALSLLALVLLGSLALTRAKLGKIALSGVGDHLQSLVFGALLILVGPAFLLLSETKWSELPRDGWSKKTLALIRGLAIATPLLLIFGALFASADAVFQNLLARTFSLDPNVVVSHFFFTGVLTWLTSGFLRLLFSPVRMLNLSGTVSVSQSLGIVEIATVIGLLDVLFLSFVLVQFRYFFGGKANIVTGRGIEYAEYARHGFFELVWVSVLVLPLLLGAHWLLRKENPCQEKIFRSLAGIKITLLSIIMISAMQRMRMYQSECGLTELRVYTMAFMGWLGIVFVWFAATVLRGQRERFAFGAIIIGLAVIAALHFVNPDQLIARVNLQRAKEGKVFDAAYTASLSADSIPVLSNGVAVVSAEERKIIMERLRSVGEQYRGNDWRSWNWSRAHAKAVAVAQP